MERKITFRIIKTPNPGPLVLMHNAARPWAVVAECEGRMISTVGRFATRGAAVRKAREETVYNK